MVGGGIKTRKGSPVMSLPFFSFNCAINQEQGKVNCCIAYNNIISPQVHFLLYYN